MKRTQIQLDEQTYQVLRERAHQRGVSMAHVVREAVERYLASPPKRKLTLEDFKFVAYGSTEQGELAPVSERHDEAWGDNVYDEMREKAEEFWRVRESREQSDAKD